MIKKTVTTVIPTYNGLMLLQKYLPSVISASRNGDEIVIVDDNSGDETITTLKKKYSLQEIEKPDNLPRIKHYYPNPNEIPFTILYGVISMQSKKVRIVLLSLKKNLRFAGAANIGVLLASHKYVFLINNDVQVNPETIENLTEHFTDPQVFAVACLEYQGTSVGEKAGKNILWFEKGTFFHNKAQNFDYGETAWASGGSAMFDKEKWLQLNGFDKAYYPAYWEDVDLSFRAKKKGWTVLFDPKSIVLHKHETTNSSIFGRRQIENMSIKNAKTFAWKNSSLLQKIQVLLWLPYWNMKQPQ